jgi:hypothetical protein
MITHEQLLELWEQDSTIDRHNLDKEALHVAKLHHKYLTHYMEVKARRIALIARLDVLRRDKEQYYSGQSTADKYKDAPFDTKIRTKAGIERYVNADPEFQACGAKIEYADLLLEGISHILESIKWRSQAVKNAIEWAKFQSGAL